MLALLMKRKGAMVLDVFGYSYYCRISFHWCVNMFLLIDHESGGHHLLLQPVSSMLLVVPQVGSANVEWRGTPADG